MVPGKDICGLKGCNAYLQYDPVKCAHCRDVPDDDLHGPRTDYGYCCYSHRRIDENKHKAVCRERYTRRWLSRIAAICSMVFICVRVELFFYDIHSNFLGFHGPQHFRNIILTWCAPSMAGRRTWNGFSYHDVMGALSFDYCINAVVLQTPLLAWLLQGHNVEVEELSAEPIKNRQVRPSLLEDTGITSSRIATHHVFAFLNPKSRTGGRQPAGLALDNTSLQYEHELKSMEISEYMRNRVQPRSIRTHNFGYHYNKNHREDLLRIDGLGFSALVLQAAMRASNNVVYNWESRKRLMNMSHNSFLSALNGLELELFAALSRLRAEIDWVRFQASWWANWQEDMQGVSDRQIGVGHTVMENMMYEKMRRPRA